MATVLADIYAIATNQDFKKRVSSALQFAAVQVSAEATGPYPNVYVKRQAFATQALKQNENFAFQYSLAVASNPVIQLNSEDDDIQFTVNSLVDAFAGVTNFDKVP